jgi:hypothetical protein
VWEAPPIKPFLDMNDAIVVEKVIIGLPDKHKRVLVVQYMYPYLLVNSSFAKTCKIIGIGRKSEIFDEYLKNAKQMVHNLLTKSEIAHTIKEN